MCSRPEESGSRCDDLKMGFKMYSTPEGPVERSPKKVGASTPWGDGSPAPQ